MNDSSKYLGFFAMGVFVGIVLTMLVYLGTMESPEALKEEAIKRNYAERVIEGNRIVFRWKELER